MLRAVVAKTTHENRRVLKIGRYRAHERIGEISRRHDEAVSPAFNRIIVKAGVPDKRGRLERALPVAVVLPTHYCNERQRVAMATRRETHTWGVAARSPFFFLSVPPRRRHSFRHERPSERPSPFPLRPPFLPRVSPLFLSLSRPYSHPRSHTPPFSPRVPSPFDLFRRESKAAASVCTRATALSQTWRFCGGVCTSVQYTFVN